MRGESNVEKKKFVWLCTAIYRVEIFELGDRKNIYIYKIEIRREKERTNQRERERERGIKLQNK